MNNNFIATYININKIIFVAYVCCRSHACRFKSYDVLDDKVYR